MATAIAIPAARRYRTSRRTDIPRRYARSETVSRCATLRRFRSADKRQMADKPLDLTLELAPRARFDVVDLRHTLPGGTSGAGRVSPVPLLVLPHHRRFPRSQPRRRGCAPSTCPTYVDAFRTHFPGRRRLPARPARAPRTSTPISARSSRGTPIRTSRSWPAACGRVSRIRTGPASRSLRRPRRRQRGTAAAPPHARRRLQPGTDGARHRRFDVPVSGHPIDSINLKDPRLGVYGSWPIRRARPASPRDDCASGSTRPSAIRR